MLCWSCAIRQKKVDCLQVLMINILLEFNINFHYLCICCFGLENAYQIIRLDIYFVFVTLRTIQSLLVRACNDRNLEMLSIIRLLTNTIIVL